MADERTKADKAAQQSSVTILAVVILAFCSCGFGSKFCELVRW